MLSAGGSMPVAISAFYRFHPLPGCAALRQPLHDHCASHGVKGIILLAPEGINATIATEQDMDAVMAGIEALTGISPLECKRSSAGAMPFMRLKVRLKSEIVTIGDRSVDPCETVGTHVEPKDWNALISDPDVLVIDTRNSFEHEFGTFRGAVDPRTESFGSFPAYVRAELAADKSRRIAMFCTGGIRCEKATSYLQREGFTDVHHLKGGILKYLEEVPEEDSLWSGGCFVFDGRVALTHGLKQADIKLCLACNAPVHPEDAASPLYEEGVACPRCQGLRTAEQLASARERQRQIVKARR
jgi:UPF0176 protein